MTAADAGPTVNEGHRIERNVFSLLREPAEELLPVVTLSWAQSVTGAIAAADGARVSLSGPESLLLTHRLRAMHDAILVGIRTVLSDDPLLSVRLVKGPQPQPVVLDSRLRFPLSARLLSRAERKPWVFHAEAPASAARALLQRGAMLFTVPRNPDGLDLQEVLRKLRGEGMRSVLVEGGTRVLRAFITQRLASQAVVTVSPSGLLGIPGPGMPEFVFSAVEKYGADIVTWGRLAR